MSQLFIDLPDALTDQPRKITATGLVPGIAKLTAFSRHADGSEWQSRADFKIDASGRLDLDADIPQAGDWQVADSMAAIWSQRQTAAPVIAALSESVAPRTVQLAITDKRGQRATAELVQRFVGAGVTRREIRENGLSATLFSPLGDGPFPLVILLNGSGGGTPEQRAALLASRGYLALALAWFNAPGRPDYISDTPLEYFEQALLWAKTTLRPRNDFIAVGGHSRGGELALLLGARFPQYVSAVIGFVPSAVVHGTLRAGRPDQARDADAWIWQGQPLRNIWQQNPDADWHAFDHPPAPGLPLRQAPAFVAVEQHRESREAARIPVERIAGPVLLLSGTDDGFWPSTAYCAAILNTLSSAGHRWRVEHISNTGAGHAIGFPGVPTTQIARVHPVAGVPIDGGGTPLANARANSTSWARVLRFLATASAISEEHV